MTITNSTLNTSSQTKIVHSREDQKLATPDGNACRFQIRSVVRDIESPAVRELIDVVFDDLLRLLECLDLIEIHLRKLESAEQTLAMFQLIHDDARDLVDFIQNDGLKPELLTEELFDTLDGIAFAVNHDLQRVFKTELQTAALQNKTHATIGKLYRVHDILTNCLQQSTITLAMVFKPHLDGAKLFNNSDMRFRQSLQLCEGLAQVIQLIETAEAKPVETVFAALTDGVRKFRNESMELLMYSDWPQFEHFCDRIEIQNDPLQLSDAIHQFRCYLETLLGQVRMRAVLTNVFPLGFGDDPFSSPSIKPVQAYSGETEWSGLAMAV